MFAPTKVWRKWHQKINLGQKRYAVASALAASAVGLLKSVGASADVAKVKNSRKLRAGKGKLRGRRHRQRRGPLVVYDPEVDGKELSLAFRNISGVETSSVFALNLLQLAPGGHLGRFIIWTSAAFKALDTIYGSTTTPSDLKKDFLLPSPVVQQADIGRLINSSELQSVIRAAIGQARTHTPLATARTRSARRVWMLASRSVLPRLLSLLFSRRIRFLVFACSSVRGAFVLFSQLREGFGMNW